MRGISIPSSKLNTPINTLAPTTSSTVVVFVVTTTTTSPPTNSSVSSPWHSPIPYLFGGLAAIMALIALSLLMLACSYWRRSIQQEDDLDNNNNVVKEGVDGSQNKEHPMFYEEKILVIMAGDHKPTFLATPSCSHPVAVNFHKNLGVSETCDKSQKDISSHHVENGSSQHEQT